MKQIIVNRAFSGHGFSYSPSDEPQKASDEVAKMAINAGFATEVKKKPTRKKATKKTD